MHEARLDVPPPRDVALWMLNDRLDPDELRRQLRGFHAAGWARVIPRTYNGLRTEYLSEEWFACLRAIIEEATRLGMRVWLQAGYMPNGVPALPPEYAMSVLAALAPKAPLEPGDTHVAVADERRIVARCLPHVLDLASRRAVAFYLAEAYERTYVRRFGAHFGQTVEAVWVDEPSLQADCPLWGETLLDRFERDWGYPLPAQAAGLFSPVGDWRRVRLHYWRTVAALLRESYFVGVETWCRRHGLLFTGHLMGEDTLRTQIGLTAAVMPLYGHMGIPGIDHLTADLRWRHGDHSAAPEAPLFIQTPVQCASAAAQRGQREVLAEMYGVASPGLNFADRKRIGEWFTLLGINVRCLHGAFYSLRGRRKRIYPPSLNGHQPWWPENRRVADRFARLNARMAQGAYAADVLVLHPIESAFCLYEPGGARDRSSGLDALDGAFARISECLLRARRGFHYGDEQILAEAGRAEGRVLAVGCMRYPAVLLCRPLTLRAATLALLEAFLDGGGTVLLAGEAPALLDAAPSPRLDAFARRVTRVAESSEVLDAALEAASPRRIAVQAGEGRTADLLMHERLMDDGRRMALLLNASETQTVEASVRACAGGSLSELDVETGLGTSLTGPGGEAAALSFAPLQSRLLVLAEDDGAAGRHTAVVRRRVAVVGGPWRVTRHDPNALVLDFCRLKVGDGEFGEPIPVAAVQQILEEDRPGAPYRGPIVMRFEADAVASRPRRAALAIEGASECKVEVNGVRVTQGPQGHYADPAFESIDIAGLLRIGRNTIDVGRAFAPLEKPAFGMQALFANLGGTEIEPAFLVGDFTVSGHASSRPPRPRCRRFAPRFCLAEEDDAVRGLDLLAEGYPFYCGRIALSRSVELPAVSAGQRMVLRCDDLQACVADVRLNGRPAGAIAWAPRALDITGVVQAGRNELVIELSGTLRNLIGPHHRPEGEPLDCWGYAAFSGRWHQASNTGYPAWYREANRASDTLAWTEDYFLTEYGLGAEPEVWIET